MSHEMNLHWASRILGMDLTGTHGDEIEPLSPRCPACRHRGDGQGNVDGPCDHPWHQHPDHTRSRRRTPLSHVRLVPNTGPDMVEHWDERSGADWSEPPDIRNETTDTIRDHTVTIAFDAATDLEASLAVDAIRGFVTRRLNLSHPVFTYTPKEGS